MMSIQTLILAGGQSSRMGSPKDLLQHPSGLPMYQYLIRVIKEACPNLDTVYISLRNENAMQTGTRPVPVEVAVNLLYDDKHPTTNPTSSTDIGPATGLLAAYHENSACRWLVVPCDFPLITADTLRPLLSGCRDTPLTCYRNKEGWLEPLLAVWSPEALQVLEENVKLGRCGPRSVVDEICDAKIIKPENDVQLLNANTTEEWQEALAIYENLYQAQ